MLQSRRGLSSSAQNREPLRRSSIGGLPSLSYLRHPRIYLHIFSLFPLSLLSHQRCQVLCQTRPHLPSGCRAPALRHHNRRLPPPSFPSSKITSFAPQTLTHSSGAQITRGHTLCGREWVERDHGRLIIPNNVSTNPRSSCRQCNLPS